MENDSNGMFEIYSDYECMYMNKMLGLLVGYINKLVRFLEMAEYYKYTWTSL